MNKIIIKNYHIFFFIFFFVIQLIIFDDYGFSWDETYSRLNGIVSFNYILDKFSIFNYLKYENVPSLENYTDKEYGVFFEIFNIIIEKFFNLENNYQIYLTRHYVNSLIFFISSIYFYLILRKFYGKYLSLFGFLIFISHPRIFAQSFYNSKDIIFLSFFCISNYYFISFLIKNKFKNLFFLTLFVSFAIATRVIGLIIPIFFIFFFLMENFNNQKIKDAYFLIFFLLATIIFTIIFWPFLWENPLNIIESIQSMSNYEWKGSVYFNGEYFSGKYLPWYYIPVTIFITSPILHIIPFIIGSVLILKFILINLLNIDKNNPNVWKNKKEIFLIYSFFVIFGTIILIIQLNSTIYNGWRQLYFIYPSIIFISIFGIEKILYSLKYKKTIQSILVILLFFNFFWLFKNHPYQYIYYNSLINEKHIKKFELDYWGVSNLEVLKNINKLNPNKKNYKIFVYSESPYDFSLNLLKKKIADKYMFTKSIAEAEYIVTNHFYQDDMPSVLDQYLNDNFTLLFQIKSDKVTINSVFVK